MEQRRKVIDHKTKLQLSEQCSNIYKICRHNFKISMKLMKFGYEHTFVRNTHILKMIIM